MSSDDAADQIAHDVLLLRSRRAIAERMHTLRGQLEPLLYGRIRNAVAWQLRLYPVYMYLPWAPRLQPEEITE